MLLEIEFAETVPDILLCGDNFSTYSSTYLKLVLEIGSEIDNVLKEMFNFAGRSEISQYAKAILAKFPSIVNQMVSVRDHDISLKLF